MTNKTHLSTMDMAWLELKKIGTKYNITPKNIKEALEHPSEELKNDLAALCDKIYISQMQENISKSIKRSRGSQLLKPII